MKILVPNTIKLDLSALEDEVILYPADQPIPAGHRDAEVLVVWRNTSENLTDAARSMPRLRLVQTLAAGPDSVLAAGFADNVAITSGRSLHDGPVAEHALALILAAVRRMDQLMESQQAATWNEPYNAAQSSPDTEQLYTLDGANVTIWGFGSIAGRLAPLLAALGANVTGVASSKGERYGFPVVADDEFHEVLRTTDVLVSILPATPETADALNGDVLQALPDTAIFVNVGRGATVDEDALQAALEEGGLRVAALDVTKDEPLPADSKLWKAPNLIITPHVAGNRPKGAARIVVSNIKALKEGSPLTNQVAG
ncbi:phosphoglycerate dehydrogenase [Paenarthrobacter aurescens]|uniref:Phosphoglycerate dehydrogenase n=1 Tax=Paenarthrobacter aurescens TaxID=43663 RepID=A0A4Y3NCR9_PAEAU|nr:phosphoglycerate dehydrogenase [Paenarthrobacter aurescens]MDO6142260.1 phosphoglycerate dehydrogenase [Paenarthrobacter aurescens]MDO6146108.1 phosphoglycerate dehydrogenase [Paenarthrobacter aurescens]MDO6157352.1 phosphoglycerate dehydrogenase [Paenarthrobacter aurescens]MDO6161337.1 phosphoglycerate dehydrogenase [Paenarthrobacter aurescens]GEB19023.1 phosphoglycerate dehydrogenase [Paenarthrobacter aurescens]